MTEAISIAVQSSVPVKSSEASKYYQNNPSALHLRAMNMIFDGLKKKGSMIIVPSTAVETMGLGALGGMTAFDRIMVAQKGPEDEGVRVE